MGHSAIRLFLVDVDGTLLTPDKRLTNQATVAVSRLRRAGVEVALASGRPPRGMRMLIEPLALTAPLAAFNGGVLVRPDLSVLEERPLGAGVARAAAELIRAHGLELWVYRGRDWYVRDPAAPHVVREQETVQFAPTVRRELVDLLDRAVKLVGLSDDLAAVARCEEAARRLGAHVSVARSQPYSVDITRGDANKGEVVARFATELGLGPDEIATIGDMPTDCLMFEVSGLSIAMGNASPEVQRRAQHVTSSNAEEGFARAALERVLPRAPSPSVSHRSDR